MITDIYAYRRYRANRLVWTLYILSLLFTNWAIFVPIVLFFSSFLDFIPTLPFSSQTPEYVFLVLMGISFIPALVNTVIMVVLTRYFGLEEILYVGSDFRRGDPSRMVWLVIVMYIILILLNVLDTLIIMLLIAPPLLLSGTAGAILELSWLQNILVFTTVLSLEIALIYLYIRYSINSVERKKEGWIQQARSSEKVKYKVTAYTPGFIGQLLGVVALERRGQSLHNRAAVVVDIIFRTPFLLVQDVSNEVFLWRYKTTWEFMGALRRRGETVFEFVPPGAVLTTDMVTPEVIKIREIGSKILFVIDKEHHIVDEISPSFTTELLPENTFDVTEIGGEMVPVRNIDGVLRISAGGGDYSIGSSDGVQFVHATTVLYVCRMESIDVYSLPPAERIFRFEFERLTKMKRVPSGEDDLLIHAASTSSGKFRNVLLRVKPDGKMYSWEMPPMWNVHLFKERIYYISVENHLMGISEQTFLYVLRQEFGDNSEEIVWGERQGGRQYVEKWG